MQILTPKPAGRAGEGFAAADVIADVSLVPPGWPDYMQSGISYKPSAYQPITAQKSCKTHKKEYTKSLLH